jgi:hypothetical protein
LAEVSGLSKSNVAKVENQLVARGILRKSASGFSLHDDAQLAEELLRGYESALRSKILIGRFRSPVRGVEDMLSNVREAFSEQSVRWAVTGGPAAYALQRFYQRVELPVFVDSFDDQIPGKLRIIPDKAGPLIFLRSFGTVRSGEKLNRFHSPIRASSTQS